MLLAGEDGIYNHLQTEGALLVIYLDQKRAN